VGTEFNSTNNPGSAEFAAYGESAPTVAEPGSKTAATDAIAPGERAVTGEHEADLSDRPNGPGATFTPDLATPSAETLLTEISVSVREVADLSRHYHIRAEQRENVIERIGSEIEELRRGERRGLLRPVLADLCRLRSDLLVQAASLPEDFDAAKAADLLRSYAESIELTLDSNGVTAYAPDGGERFDPRLHRRVGGQPTNDPGLAGHVAEVRRHGYLDVAANSPITPAEVTVFASAKGMGEKQ
jgi:molecular chaperone GrpE (heat shock protein)